MDVARNDTVGDPLMFGRLVWAAGSVPPPTVSSVALPVGDADGGFSVTITGTNFTGATGVTFGGSAATSVVVVGPTTITCVTPAHAVGAVSVLVTTPGGTNGANTAFEYWLPTVQSGIKAWYRMDLGQTTGGGNLTALADQSGTGDAAKNLTNTGTVVYNTTDAAYGNKATTQYAAASRLQGSGVWAASQAQPMTAYCVGHATNANERIFDGAGGNRFIVMNDGGLWSVYAGSTFVDGAGTTPANPSIICAVSDSTSAIYVFDSTTAKGSGSAGTDTLTRMTLAALTGGGGELTGKIAEVFLYSGAHTQAQRLKTFQYLSSRYGLAVT